MKNNTYHLSLQIISNARTVGKLLDHLNLKIATGSSCFVNGNAIQVCGEEQNKQLNNNDVVSVAVIVQPK